MARGILLDVDGTLIDTNYLHAVAWARAFRRFGIDVSTARLHRLVGMGSEHLLEEVCGDAGWSDISEAHGEEMLRSFHDDYRAFPRVRELLQELRSRGLTLTLASSAKERDLPVIMRALGAEDLLDEVVTSADVERSKPSPDVFAVALERSGVPAERSLALGDTRWDVEASGRVGVPCVCVETGGWAAQELAAAGAVAVYRDVADLLDHLDESPIAAL